jgi:hypothetical protein
MVRAYKSGWEMAAAPKQIVVSASRRTDIPAFYMPWFMDRINAGYFEVTNPYNHKVFQVPATPDRVHTIVFWSKNFRPFMDGNYGEALLEKGFHLFFNFSVNSEDCRLEPRVPPLTDRCQQLVEMARCFGPGAIQWRFDPICFYEDATGKRRNNLEDFSRIAETAAACGVARCITSFMDHYRKIDRRIKQMPAFRFLDPPLGKKIEVLQRMASLLAGMGISLFTCCEQVLIDQLPLTTEIRPAACIPGDYLRQLYGGNLSPGKDRGQRSGAGCGCSMSSDIGSYDWHVCGHNCLYCYANASP